jgi:hypothetical protein
MADRKNEEMEELRRQITAKNRELKTVYGLVNRYKTQITDLDIAIVNKEVETESLQEIIAGMRAQAEDKAKEN